MTDDTYSLEQPEIKILVRDDERLLFKNKLNQSYEEITSALNSHSKECYFQRISDDRFRLSITSSDILQYEFIVNLNQNDNILTLIPFHEREAYTELHQIKHNTLFLKEYFKVLLLKDGGITDPRNSANEFNALKNDLMRLSKLPLSVDTTGSQSKSEAESNNSPQIIPKLIVHNVKYGELKNYTSITLSLDIELLNQSEALLNVQGFQGGLLLSGEEFVNFSLPESESNFSIGPLSGRKMHIPVPISMFSVLGNSLTLIKKLFEAFQKSELGIPGFGLRLRFKINNQFHVLDRNLFNS